MPAVDSDLSTELAARFKRVKRHPGLPLVLPHGLDVTELSLGTGASPRLSPSRPDGIGASIVMTVSAPSTSSLGAAIGYAKNPTIHRDVSNGATQAAQLIAFATYLLEDPLLR